jgi:hypothetical protein
MRASSSVESAIPLRGYFLSVGGALLLLLFAADWVLPAPLPIRFDESHSVLPPIRILSELKRPEVVVIDTNQAAPTPMPPDEIALTTSQLPTFDVANAAQQPRSSVSEQLDESESSLVTSPLTVSPARESLAQLEPVVRDQAGLGLGRRVAKSEPQRKFAQARSWKRQPARHPRFDRNLGWCDSWSRQRGSCRYAFMHSRRTKSPFREAQD